MIFFLCCLLNTLGHHVRRCPYLENFQISQTQISFTNKPSDLRNHEHLLSYLETYNGLEKMVVFILFCMAFHIQSHQI